MAILGWVPFPYRGRRRVIWPDKISTGERHRYLIGGQRCYVESRTIINGCQVFLLFPETHRWRGEPRPDGYAVRFDGILLCDGIASLREYYDHARREFLRGWAYEYENPVPSEVI